MIYSLFIVVAKEDCSIEDVVKYCTRRYYDEVLVPEMEKTIPFTREQVPSYYDKQGVYHIREILRQFKEYGTNG